MSETKENVLGETGMRRWIIKGSDLTKRYGPGCAYCARLTGPEEGNQCPVCGTVTACAKLDFDLESSRKVIARRMAQRGSNKE